MSTQGVLGVQGPVGYPGIRGVKVRHHDLILAPPRLFPHDVQSACAIFLRVTDKLFRCVTDG